MARLKNQKVLDQNRARLLELGVELIRSHSFQSIGIKDILKLAEIPKDPSTTISKTKKFLGFRWHSSIMMTKYAQQGLY